jgi:Fe-S cluster biosynthesis and repair protein YggX
MKIAKQILQERNLLIEDGKTCEAHTHLVIEAMQEYAEQTANGLAETVEETTGATIHFYYSKQKGRWVCWYAYQSFLVNESLSKLLEETRKYILDNREEVGRHYKMKENK